MTDQDDTENDDNVESDLEREHVGVEILEHLDDIEEILHNSTIDVDEDEQFIEIADLVQRIKDIINKE